MLFRRLAVAGTVVVALVLPGLAQDLRGPRELPPAGFRGEQYVDSGGCVFLRAGFGEQVNWVARISRERRQLCGMPPSFAPAQVEVAGVALPEVAEPVPLSAANTTPVSAARIAGVDPASPTAVSRIQPAGSPPPAVASLRTVAVEPHAVLPSSSGQRLIACPASAPVARRFAVEGGGSKVLCVPAGMGPVGFVVPKGYRRAWTDDRLNPLRGLGTGEGQAMQDRVWTPEVPARLTATLPVTTRPPAVGEAAGDDRVARVPTVSDGATVVTRSTSTAPKAAPVAATGRFFVQVGSFGVPSNADAARGRLTALGLPVASGKGAIRGKAVQVVYAGPFARADQAQAALRTARGAGFGDAFLR